MADLGRVIAGDADGERTPMGGDGESKAKSGDYFRVDYDPHLARFSANHPGWWNVHDYLGRPRLLDAGWYEAVAAGLAAMEPAIIIGRLAEGWPTASASCVGRGRTWLRLDLSLGRCVAGSVLLLCGVDRTSETSALRHFNATVGSQPRAYQEAGWARPYRMRERPLCASVWQIDKNDALSSNTVNLALQAVAAAYFRSKWVA